MKLGATKLEKEDVCLKEHLFGHSNELMTIICVALVPSTGNVSPDNEPVRFNIKFDVIGRKPTIPDWSTNISGN